MPYTDSEEFARAWKYKIVDLFNRLQEENSRLDKLLGEKRLDELKVAREIIAQNCILNEENVELQQQVDELKVGRENVQKILTELGKCGNDKERYVVWVKLIKYCGVEVE